MSTLTTSGAGVISQSTISGAISAADIPASLLARNYSTPSYNMTPVFDGRLTVGKAENGYVLTVSTSNNKFETYVATNVEELNRLITRVLVEFRLEAL